MNSPTIAAVASGLKPQTEHSARAVEQNAEQGDSFANVLAQQAAPQRAESQTDAVATAPDDALAGETAANDARIDEPRTGEDIVDAKDQAKPEALGSTLPHIALEIALHARHQAQSKSEHSEAKAFQAASTGHQDRRHAMASGQHTDATLRQAAASAMQTDATLRQAGQAKETVALKELPVSAGTTGLAVAQAAAVVTGDGTTQPLSKRLGAHQTELTPAASAATVQNKNSLRTSASVVDKTATQAQNLAASLSAATQNLTGASEPAAYEPRPSFTEAPSISLSSAASVNPFSLPSSATLAATGPTAIATPMHQPGWSTDFGRQVVLLARDFHNGTQTAELRLDPPELGPLRISLSLNDGMASALFVSAHASVRHAVEAALPQLSQQLADAGIALGDAHVGDQDQAGFAFNKGEEQSGLPGSGTAQSKAAAQDPAQAPRRALAANALVDTFA